MSARLQAIAFDRPLREIRLAHPGLNSACAAASPAGDQAAYERGHREGQKALNDQLMEQRRELIDLQSGVFESLKSAVPHVIRETENALAQLALEVAQKLVAGLPISPEMVETAIREALVQLEESTEFHIYLHPEDILLLKQVDSELLKPSPCPPHFQFLPTSETSRGGCLVKTRFGILDASRENKFETLKAAVFS
jgi:flagellar assembly protein FliH